MVQIFTYSTGDLRLEIDNIVSIPQMAFSLITNDFVWFNETIPAFTLLKLEKFIFHHTLDIITWTKKKSSIKVNTNVTNCEHDHCNRNNDDLTLSHSIWMFLGN